MIVKIWAAKVLAAFTKISGGILVGEGEALELSWVEQPVRVVVDHRCRDGQPTQILEGME